MLFHIDSRHQVLNLCSATVGNFYAPIRDTLIEKLAARRRSRARIRFNVQEVAQMRVVLQGTGFLNWMTGGSKKPLEALMPTHARFTTPGAPSGLFHKEQAQSVFEIPLVATKDSDVAACCTAGCVVGGWLCASKALRICRGACFKVL